MAAPPNVARQYLGSVGKIDNGIVAVTSLWAHEQRYYPLHMKPYTPESCLAGGKQDPDFQTKPQIAQELIEHAQAAGIAFKAIVADCFYGDNNALEGALQQRRLPYVLAHRATIGRGWAPAHAAHSFEEAAQRLPRSAWQKIERRFRDGHTEQWWAAELTLPGYGRGTGVRTICATTDRRTLPDPSTWYLTTNLPSKRALLAEVVRLYGLRNWVEQGYKQMKDELGWADFMVRSSRAICRHWALVCCAFAYCWWREAGAVRACQAAEPARKKNGSAADAVLLAAPAARGAGVADADRVAHALLARVLRRAPISRAHRFAGIPYPKQRLQPLSPHLTNYR